jgi:succinate dehydrogenase/fumarate reductase flavoprotein subunit
MIRNVPTEQVGSIDMDPYTGEDFFGDIMRVGDNKSDPQLARAVVDASRETISWLSNSVGLPFWFSFHRQGG